MSTGPRRTQAVQNAFGRPSTSAGGAIHLANLLDRIREYRMHF